MFSSWTCVLHLFPFAGDILYHESALITLKCILTSNCDPSKRHFLLVEIESTSSYDAENMKSLLSCVDTAMAAGWYVVIWKWLAD